MIIEKNELIMIITKSLPNLPIHDLVDIMNHHVSPNIDIPEMNHSKDYYCDGVKYLGQNVNGSHEFVFVFSNYN